MAGIFTAREVAEWAVQIEERGYNFYLRLTEKTQDQATRELFEYLAGEERKHKATFRALAERLGPLELPAWSNAAEYQEYLSALIDTHTLFTAEAGELAEKAETRDQALRVAMGFEKDTILFFSEMRALVPQGERSFIEQCIAEEREHLTTLRRMLES